MRESWTDARLDDFAGHVDQRFDAVDRRFDAVDQRFEHVDVEMRALRQEMNQRFDRADAKFEALQREVSERFDRMHRLMIQLGAGVGGGIVAALIGVIATQL